MHVLSQGFGAGDKDFPMQANVLRVLIGEARQVAESATVTGRGGRAALSTGGGPAKRRSVQPPRTARPTMMLLANEVRIGLCSQWGSHGNALRA